MVVAHHWPSNEGHAMTEMAKAADERPDAELAYRVLDQIDAHPELWDQETWLSRPEKGDCGTAGCFAGWTCLLAGDKPAWNTLAGTVTGAVIVQESDQTYICDVEIRASELLNISNDAADTLFEAGNTRDDLESVVGRVFGPRPVATPERGSDRAGECTCSFGPEDAHFADCPLYEPSERGE